MQQKSCQQRREGVDGVEPQPDCGGAEHPHADRSDEKGGAGVIAKQQQPLALGL